jgi:hypothetical protein
MPRNQLHTSAFFLVEEHTMDTLGSLSLWSLSAIALAGVTIPIWQISRIGRHNYFDDSQVNPLPSAGRTPVPALPVQVPGGSEPAQKQTRPTKWISVDVFRTLLGDESNHPVVIDLRPESQWTPFPIPDVFVLRLAPQDLIDVLAWLPPDRSVVFYGASNFSIFLIEISGCMEGSAPLYFLEGDLCREAA